MADGRVCKVMHIDVESYSSVDLTKSSVYRYTEAPDFSILLFGYAFDDDPVEVIDLTKKPLPGNLMTALKDPSVIKLAFNSQFERVCLSQYLNTALDPTQWQCVMVHAATLGLPRTLAEVGRVLGLPEEQQKMKEGKQLIQYFCKPCKPTKSNGGRTRNRPQHDPTKWETFIEYNRRDVETEREIRRKLDAFPVAQDELKAYWMDQRINDRGVLVDEQLMDSAIRMNYEHAAELSAEAKLLTGLENVNSVAQLKHWLGVEGALDKKAVQAMRKSGDLSDLSDRVLAIRQELGKTSVSKYEAMERGVCSDGRVRGLFAFYGANRTGRWAGRQVQVQNLPQNHIPDLELAREIVKSGDRSWLQCAFGNVPNVLSELIRTAFIAKPGHTFCVADFSAIEARVVAWLADETWRQELFRQGGDIYCQSASKMFHVPVEKHGINGHLRQKGKVAELACIAEGQLVLTDRGEIPIEEVKLTDKLWDGENWVTHDGLIYKGRKLVITYDGLTATYDHEVWIEGRKEPIPFGFAARDRARLVRSGYSSVRETEELEESPRTARVYDIRNAGEHHRFTVSGRLVHNCGYGGSVGAMINMGALDMGIPEEELQPIVTAWREASPHIVELWWLIDKAARETIQYRLKDWRMDLPHGLSMRWLKGLLHVRLPSGREIRYWKPEVEDDGWKGKITYEGVEIGKWARIDTYGPKIFENIVQATARDCLRDAMMKVEQRYPGIVMHIHDEMVVEVHEDKANEALAYMLEVMSTPVSWAPGLILKGDGYQTGFYKKD